MSATTNDEATARLIHDLEIRRTEANADALGNIIRNARKHLYHDFKATLATPKLQLYEDLRSAGLIDLAQKVVEGDYDE